MCKRRTSVEIKENPVQQKWTYGLWGAVLGAGACMIIGFTWGGWSTSKSATAQAEAASWTALVPVCADTILANEDAVAALKTKKPNDYDDVVRDFRSEERRVGKECS